jgi:hypothetical protein
MSKKPTSRAAPGTKLHALINNVEAQNEAASSAGATLVETLREMADELGGFEQELADKKAAGQRELEALEAQMRS